ncbi:hypothetical protein GCM10018952_15980 [Streptosporangium vulgare]
MTATPVPAARSILSHEGMVCQAGGLLPVETLRATGLDKGLSQTLARWRAPRAVHDPGKIVTGLAVTLALGGDCLADIALLRSSPEVSGPVASDPTVSRLVKTLADAGPKALRTIRAARAAARARAWALAGERAPGAGGTLIPVDLDATIVIAHSEKEHVAPTWKHTYGFHPMTASIDRGEGGTGEAAALPPRRGNAGSNTADDHITAGRRALNQIPAHPHEQVLIRTDSGGGTHAFLSWVSARHLKYSIGFTLTDGICAAILALPEEMWEVAYNADRQPRDGAWVTELTGMLDLSSWPKGMRVIVRRERPPELSCASPTSTATASPVSSPAPVPVAAVANSPTWNYDTAAGPAARTASALPKTAGCGIYPCTASIGTRSGWNRSHWPES